MNIFEDLIEELKEENLLEETVTEVQRNKINSRASNFHDSNFSSPDKSKTEPGNNFQQASVFPQATGEPVSRQAAVMANGRHGETEYFTNHEPAAAIADSPEQDEAGEQFFDSEKKNDQAEFYRKRAADEVNSLQMVEHVLSGIERELLHITPKLYDDLEVKKSLHTFLQFSQNINSPEQAQAEFLLMQETEGWYSALSQKDKNINVADLRRYCETTRPALSPQALAALARFYRNAPFSESVRSKFDLVMTRFFSREAGGDIRTLIFSRDEIIEKLNEFYAEWSSIPLYATEEDESNIVLAAMRFEDFMTEADAAENFEDLIKNGFFQQLKDFKQSAHENFFAPLVMAAAIECNVRIGNRYVELLLNEKDKSDSENLEEKYGLFHSQTISDTVCKTIRIADLFEGKFADAEIVKELQSESAQQANQIQYEKQDLKAQRVKPKSSKKVTKNPLYQVNKWLLSATILIVLASVGLYLYVEYFNPPPKLSGNVKVVNLENSSLKEFIKTARLNGDMFYGVVTPNWDGLSNEKKEELLRKVILVGAEQGFIKVSLMDKEGRSVGFASPEKVEVYNP